MPQFYWFTFAGSIIIGWLAREYIINFSRNDLIIIFVLAFLIFLNEKTAFAESIINYVTGT